MTHWEGHFRSTERIGPSGQKEEKPPSRTCHSAQPPPPPPAPPGLGPAPSFPSPRQPTFERCPFCTDPKHNSAKPGGGGGQITSFAQEQCKRRWDGTRVSKPRPSPGSTTLLIFGECVASALQAGSMRFLFINGCTDMNKISCSLFCWGKKCFRGSWVGPAACPVLPHMPPLLAFQTN